VPALLPPFPISQRLYPSVVMEPVTLLRTAGIVSSIVAVAIRFAQERHNAQAMAHAPKGCASAISISMEQIVQ